MLPPVAAAIRGNHRAKAGALAVAERRVSESASGVASVWVAAWTKAGKPKLPVDTPRTPAKIRK